MLFSHDRLRPLVAALIAAFALSACGGGSDDDNAPVATTPPVVTTPAADPATPSAPAGLRSVDTAPVSAVAAFVDNYKTNTTANTTQPTNAALRVLGDFLKLWTPGSSWDNGVATAVGAPILASNIQQVKDIATTRTVAEQQAAYLDDRRNQNYSMLSGLGPLLPAYLAGSGAVTTIADVAADATSVKYDDAGNGAGGGALGNVAALIGTVRGSSSSSNPSKSFFQYMRPFRWASDTSIVLPTLRPAISATPASDGGFPSGHTNAAYLAGYALAYAIPERYQELMTRASQLGQNRIVAGMHSPMDVMGGRLLSTALAAAILSDPANTAAKSAAYTQAHSYLQAQTGTDATNFYAFAHSTTVTADPQADAAVNRAAFLRRLTYGFPQIAASNSVANVPKNAEVLLETRLPYLDAAQRRVVLKTTALPSGYPLLDDAEGWGRLNLFAAADGYGAFNGDVTVVMDAALGGFNATDRWSNAIAGAGKLLKQGSGSLALAGSNSYTGGTEVQAGTLVAASAAAFGKGDVYVSGGTVRANAPAPLVLGGNYTQLGGGTLAVTLGTGGAGTMAVAGNAFVGGTLTVTLAAGYQPAAGDVVTVIGAARRYGQFANVQVNGSSIKATAVYTESGVQIRFGT